MPGHLGRSCICAPFGAAQKPEGLRSIAGAAGAPGWRLPTAAPRRLPPTRGSRSRCRADRLTVPASISAMVIAKSEDDPSCAIIAHLRCRRPRRDGEDEVERSVTDGPHAPAKSARSLAIWWRHSGRYRGPCFTGPGTAHLLVVRLKGATSLDNRPNDILHVAVRLTRVKPVL